MVEELMSESLNYSRYVEETASDPARDTDQQLAIHSESRKKGVPAPKQSTNTRKLLEEAVALPNQPSTQNHERNEATALPTAVPAPKQPTNTRELLEEAVALPNQPSTQNLERKEATALPTAVPHKTQQQEHRECQPQ